MLLLVLMIPAARIGVAEGQPIRKISFPEEEFVLLTGEKGILKLDIQPRDASNQTLFYKSNDQTIATVRKDGTIVAWRPGSCLVTAEAMDGSAASVRIPVRVIGFRLSEEQKHVKVTERQTCEIILPAQYNNARYYIRKAGYPNLLMEKLTEDSGWYEVNQKEVLNEETGETELLPVIRFDPIREGSADIDLRDMEGTYGAGTKEIIRVRVDASAMYGTKAFPQLNYAKALKNAKEMIGQTVCVQGTLTEILTEDGVVYKVATKGKDGNAVLAKIPEAYEDMPPMETGKWVRIYGTWMEPRVYETETGEAGTELWVMVEKINDRILNEKLELTRYQMSGEKK